MSVTKLLAISLGAILTNNFIFSQFLGICPFLGVSKKSDTAIGMGLAVTFVMGLASAFCYGVNIILVKLGLDYMQTVAFILVVASLVQFIEMFLKKSMPTLYTALGVYLPLITTNCAVLGVTLMNIDDGYSFGQSLVNAAFSGLGFALAMVIFSGVRSRVDDAEEETPSTFRGVPATLIAAAIVSMSFLGFGGLGQ